MIDPRTFLEVRSPLQPHRPCEYEEPISTGFQMVVTKKGHKGAALFPAPLFFHNLVLSVGFELICNVVFL